MDEIKLYFTKEEVIDYLKLLGYNHYQCDQGSYGSHHYSDIWTPCLVDYASTLVFETNEEGFISREDARKCESLSTVFNKELKRKLLSKV